MGLRTSSAPCSLANVWARAIVPEGLSCKRPRYVPTRNEQDPSFFAMFFSFQSRMPPLSLARVAYGPLSPRGVWLLSQSHPMWSNVLDAFNLSFLAPLRHK